MKKLAGTVILLFSLFFSVTLAGRTVYITRHGQVGDPECKAFNGERALTKLGEAQAVLLGKYLKQKNFNGVIYASPLYRTMQTADFIAQYNNCGFLVDQGLQEYAPVFAERNQGKYGICAEGCDRDDIRKYFPRAGFSARFTYPWRLMNEPEKMRHERSGKTLDAILAETDQDILLVGHSATVKSLMYVLSRRSDKAVVAVPWNCCLVTVKLDDNNRVISYTVETGKYLAPEQVTNNFRKPLVPKPGDTRYVQ